MSNRMSVTPTPGLNKARELMPLLEAAKAESPEAYRAALAQHGVTMAQVRQWRRRRKKADGAVTPTIIKVPVEYTSPEPTKVKLHVAVETRKLVPAKKAVTPESNPIRIKLTEAQMREAKAVQEEDSQANYPRIKGKSLIFRYEKYQNEAKEYVLALEKRIANLNKAHKDWRNSQNSSMLHDLLDWNNTSPEAKKTKQIISAHKGAIKACDGAINAIVYGNTKTEDNILDWYNEEHVPELERRAEEKYQRTIAELDAKRDTPVQSVTELEKPKGVTTVTESLHTVITGYEIKKDGLAYVVFEIDEKSEYIYRDTKKKKSDYRESCPNADSMWHFSVYSINGTMSCEVYMPGADENAIVTALYEKYRDTLTRLNLWVAADEQGYREAVAEWRETRRIDKERRSLAASRAAQTRAVMKAAGQRR